MALQLAFAAIILFKGCDGEEFGRVELVRIGLRALIVDMLCAKAWNGVLILTMSVSVLTMSIYLVRAYFLIFFHKDISSKAKSIIIPKYIVAYGEALKRLTFDR